MNKILALIFILMSASLFTDLQIVIDDNRFLDEKLNTILEINYEIPYKELLFIKTENGFEAQLKIDFKVFSEDQEVYKQEFTNQIILTNQEKTVSDGNFLDKISLTLAKSDFRIDLNFNDINTNEQFHWEYFFTKLDQNTMISDLEFSYEIKSDTTTYLQKFHRWDHLFLANPSHVYDLKINKKLFLYYEISGFFKNSEDLSELTETITILNHDEIVKQNESEISENRDIINRIKELDLEKFEPGYYTLEVKIVDNVSGYQEVKKDFFSTKNNIETTIRIFPDLEDDFGLIKYFLPSSQVKYWRDLTLNGKNNYLKRFWEINDPNPLTEENEFLSLIKERIEYTKMHFSHYDEGWTTDRGRIYIRNGPPDEVLKLKTGFYTKYATKDYEIWKYRGNNFFTYIFIDLVTSGNYKMIYSDNDDREITMPDWNNYLDSDFDESLLE